tara:strand:+ start:1389 stop:1736 length:348 start_codon:yes stop_codon:yes gene_type:complete
MFKHWISYLLIVLIACQSVLAVADSHDTQTTFPIIGFDQADLVQSELNVNEINKQDASQVISVDSCDHCGFCHYGQSIPSLLAFFSLLSPALHKSQYHDAAPGSPQFSFYRPPQV